MSERLRVSSLIITNPTLTPKHVEGLVASLRSGKINNHNYGSIFVYFDKGRYYVNDGNHFVRACQIAGIEWVLAEVYSL